MSLVHSASSGLALAREDDDRKRRRVSAVARNVGDGGRGRFMVLVCIVVFIIEYVIGVWSRRMQSLMLIGFVGNYLGMGQMDN